MKSVGLSEEEWSRTRCMLVDRNQLVIAASDAPASLKERYYVLRNEGRPHGHYESADYGLVGFSVTPGYETYKGLGWYGVTLNNLPRRPPDSAY